MHIQNLVSNYKHYHKMDFVSRLKQYLALRAISVTQFADECDIPRPTASQLLAGRNKKVSDEIIGKIHSTYPEVSVVWLMFGEGDMMTTPNIKTSEPQNAHVSNSEQSKMSDNKLYPSLEKASENFPQNSSENQPMTAGHDDRALYGIFDFSQQNGGAQATPSTQTFIEKDGNASTTTPGGRTNGTIKTSPANNNENPAPISITPGAGKSVTGIVVYYSDSTYESFVPDPEGRHPFMR